VSDILVRTTPRRKAGLFFLGTAMQRQAVSMVRHPEDPRFASGTRDLASSLSRFRNNSA